MPKYKITSPETVKKRYMSFKALQQTVRDLGIKNRNQYAKWIRTSEPRAVPAYPFRIYPEWTTWGEFLGTGSEFVPFIKWKEMQKKNWRSYWESARWVQKQGYKSARAFLAAHRRGEIPSDIPRAPHQVYLEKYRGGWVNWPSFLGKTIESKIKTMTNIQKLFAIAGVPGYPQNYFKVLVAPTGKEQLAGMIDTPAFRVYEYDDSNQSQIGQVIQSAATSQGGGMFLSNNMSNLFFELDSAFVYNREIGNEIQESLTAT